tara:strand:+ start:9231 stop:9851 length:621 start_codon:yes stop_codon:yes gene_type:complete
MRVVYHYEGRFDISQSFSNLGDQSDAAIIELIKGRYPAVLREWDAIEAAPDTIGELVEGIVHTVDYAPPVPVADPEPTPAELSAQRINDLKDERAAKEGEGIFWADVQGDAFMFDSTIESQNRIVAAIAAIDTGDRVDGGVWKCAQVDSVGEPTLVFRPMTNIELGAVGTLFNAHIQQCFETEAVCVAQVMAGNLDVDFQAEFEDL